MENSNTASPDTALTQKYVLIRELGEGTFGKVKLGKNILSG
jgi:hypothetical protein